MARFFMDFKSRDLIPVGTRPQQVAPRLWLKTCRWQLFFTRRPLGSFCRAGSEPEPPAPKRVLWRVFINLLLLKTQFCVKIYSIVLIKLFDYYF